MINSEEFTKRLQKVMEFYNESSASFAEKIGVQRSSISHILSGRNKPSLDFVLKILSSYPEVELYWLLNGKGNFPNITPPYNFPENKTQEKKKQKESITEVETKKTIERIVVFYTDGSFKNYQN